VVSTLPLTTDSDGKATFSVSGLPDLDPDVDRDEYQVDIVIQPRPDGNAERSFVDGDGDPLLPYLRVAGDATTATGESIVGSVTFSTEDSSRETGSVSVESAADYVAAAGRGASNRATVSVADQYGDALPGSRVWLTTTLLDSDGDPLAIGGGRSFAVGRDGSYTFGYEREGDSGATETLTSHWDHDGDTCSAADILESSFTTWNVHLNNDADDDNDVTWDHDDDGATDPVNVTKDCFDQRPVLTDAAGEAVRPGDPVDGDADDRAVDDFKGSVPKTGPATVQWAAAAPDDPEGADPWVIQEFDTETNTIFVATVTGDDVDAGSALVLGYDSNDRFDKEGEASSYASFEKALAKGASLTWEIVGSGSRAVNYFNVTPAA
jgi:hypothetical protein